MAEHASYVAVIRRTSDGLERRYPVGLIWSDGEAYQWTEGNYACDCNRHLAFMQAGGDGPNLNDPACVCGSTRYQVIRFEFPDGSSLSGPDKEIVH